jgi:hypothetical protein
MPKDTITLALSGDNLRLEAFAKAVSELFSLLDSLSREIGGREQITWVVQDLSGSSAIAVIRGITPSKPELVESIVAGYGTIGHALEVASAIPYPDRVAIHARAIADLLRNGSEIESIRFETPDQDSIIRPQPTQTFQPSHLTVAFGAVEGNVQTLTNRGGLRFTLYDQLFDKAVSCYLRPGDEERMRNLWGKRVIIEGRVARDPISGRAVTIRDISEITPLVEGGGYQRAKGALPFKPGQLSPEELIRRVRDA